MSNARLLSCSKKKLRYRYDFKLCTQVLTDFPTRFYFSDASDRFVKGHTIPSSLQLPKDTVSISTIGFRDASNFWRNCATRLRVFMSNTVLGMRHLAITQLRTSWFTILKTQDIRGFHFYTHDLQFLHCALEWWNNARYYYGWSRWDAAWDFELANCIQQLSK